MSRYRQTLKLGALAFSALLMFKPALAGDWVDEWFDKSTSGSPGHFETQKRGYYSAGSFSARMKMGTDFPVTVSPPKLEVGCGGIDMFAGGLSYLDEEYLVQKLERILQAAPAMAFDMAMKEYCKVCSATMQAVNEVSDFLNSMQVNDCRMAQRIAAIPMNGDFSSFSDVRENAVQRYSLMTNNTKNAWNFKEEVQSSDGKVPVDTQGMTQNCPALFKQLFLNPSEPSVLENLGQAMGLEDQVALMRGFVGDVNISYSSSDNLYMIHEVSHCEKNDMLGTGDFVAGLVEVADKSGSCSVSSMSSVMSKVQLRMDGIVNKMKNKQPLSSDDIQFLEVSSLPLQNILRDAVKNGIEGPVSTMLAEPVAISLSHKMMDDLYRTIAFAVEKGQEVTKVTRTGAGQSQSTCDIRLLDDGIRKLSDMGNRAIKMRENAQSNYQKVMASIQTDMQMAKYMLEQSNRAQNAEAISEK